MWRKHKKSLIEKKMLFAGQKICIIITSSWNDFDWNIIIYLWRDTFVNEHVFLLKATHVFKMMMMMTIVGRESEKIFFLFSQKKKYEKLLTWICKQIVCRLIMAPIPLVSLYYVKRGGSYKPKYFHSERKLLDINKW